MKRGRKRKVKPKLQHQAFWITLGVVFFLSGITIFTSMDRPAITANAAVQTIGYAEEGSQLFFEVRNVAGLKDATITFAEVMKNGRITFTDNENLPFDGQALAKFTISSPDADKVASTKITFKIPKEDLRNVDEEKIILLHNQQRQPVIKTKEEVNHVYFTSSTRQFGNFVLGQQTKKIIVPKPLQATEPEIDILELTEEEVMEGVEETQQQETIEPETQIPAPGFLQGITDFFKNLLG